jgi:hypothetical protein
VFVQVNNGDVRAFLGEGDGHGAADPAVTAGNDCDFILQFSAAAVFVVLRFGPGRHLVLAAGLLRLGLRG